MGRALGEAKREAQTVDDAANNNKQGEKEARDEGVLFIAGSEKRAKRNAKSTQRSNIGSPSRTSIEEKSHRVRKAKRNQSQRLPRTGKDGSQQHSPCKIENDFGKSKRTRQSFGKKASGQKTNNQAKAHRAHLGT
ncbi:hypothetical protein [Slackia isoflavoniconvertens]|uniref:hypothetical protein n=1 Tax=Slackia isoflavoniconvertens TaxID=572010 RepID=UPI003AB9658F